VGVAARLEEALGPASGADGGGAPDTALGIDGDQALAPAPGVESDDEGTSAPAPGTVGDGALASGQAEAGIRHPRGPR
jgi:hypothetical protein